MLAGPHGFVTSPDPRSLTIDAKPVAGDALEGRLQGLTSVSSASCSPRAGATASTAASRRTAAERSSSRSSRPSATVPNTFMSADGAVSIPRRGTHRGHRLTPSQRAWIASADTFFIASGHRGEGESPTFGMDASHRGGDPGFVQVDGDTLVFPDYAGNNHFNTIGNLVADPRAGLLFVDFERGSLLQLTGRATIDWDSDAVARIPGARRLVTFAIEEIVELPAALPLRWDAGAGTVHSLRLLEKVRESADVTSFVFEAKDGGVLPGFTAGQHLPIALDVPGLKAPVRRTYSLSSAPGATAIASASSASPAASPHATSTITSNPGPCSAAQRPAGDFVLPRTDGPLVLVSAGIGVTPMVRDAARPGRRGLPAPGLVRARCARWRLPSAGARSPHARRRRPAIRVHVAYSQPRPEDALGADYDSQGRVDDALLAGLRAAPTPTTCCAARWGSWRLSRLAWSAAAFPRTTSTRSPSGQRVDPRRELETEDELIT